MNIELDSKQPKCGECGCTEIEQVHVAGEKFLRCTSCGHEGGRQLTCPPVETDDTPVTPLSYTKKTKPFFVEFSTPRK